MPTLTIIDFDWLWQGILSNGLYALLILAGGVVLAVMRAKSQRLFLPIVWFFIGSALISVVVVAVVYLVRSSKPNELSPTLRADKLETTIHEWLDTFGYSVQRVNPPEDPSMTFELIAKGPGSDVSILIFSKKNIPQYLSLQTAIALGPDDRNQIAKMTPDEVLQIGNEFVTQLAQARVNWLPLSDPLFSKNVSLFTSIPITNAVTDAALLDKLNEVELDSIMARGLLMNGIKRRMESRKP
jgi:hypothetical protein